MNAFQVGATYACLSVCDSECVWSFTIVARTASTIKTACGKTLRLNKVLSNYNNAETVLPMGNYSMCPILTAKKVVTA